LTKTTVTLVHKNCGRNCRICAYGAMAPVDYETVRKVVETLLRQGYRVHLYDFYIRKESIDIFRLTRQFEGRNPGWLNVTPEVDLGPEELAYVNRLRTAVAVSLHGSTEEVHRRSSGKNDFQAIMRFITEFRERFRLRLGVNYVVSRSNVDDLEALIEVARPWGLDFLEIIPLGYSGNAVSVLGHDAVLTVADKRRVHRLVSRRKNDTPYRLELDAIWGPDFDNDPAPQCRFFASAVPGTYCNAGVNHWAIRLNDMQVFPCPCMAGIDSLAIGHFGGQTLDVDQNWLDHKSRIEEPCRSCDKFASCQGGCRLTAMSDFRIAHGRDNRFAGFATCLYNLARGAP
jgi:radical SAM protein with 4Fe4S-binding SPASM domain